MSEPILQPVDLVTERLRLRRFRASDAALVQLHASDARVARMTERIPHPYPPGLAEAMIERLAPGAPGEVGWAIDIGAEEENGLIGSIVLRVAVPGSARIGYWIAPAFWNTGYAGEAVGAVVAHAATLGLHEIGARVFQDNAASVRVLLRAGFAYVDDGEAHSVGRGGMVATHNYRRALSGVGT
jgi:RimJ/RimL family protein N-acetyltransferase